MNEIEAVVEASVREIAAIHLNVNVPGSDIDGIGHIRTYYVLIPGAPRIRLVFHDDRATLHINPPLDTRYAEPDYLEPIKKVIRRLLRTYRHVNDPRWLQDPGPDQPEPAESQPEPQGAAPEPTAAPTPAEPKKRKKRPSRAKAKPRHAAEEPGPCT